MFYELINNLFYQIWNVKPFPVKLFQTGNIWKCCKQKIHYSSQFFFYFWGRNTLYMMESGPFKKGTDVSNTSSAYVWLDDGIN